MSDLSCERSEQLFNRGFFDRNDPTEAVGILLPSFCLYNVYQIKDKEMLTEICNRLYSSVEQVLKKGGLSDNVKCKLVEYRDAKNKNKEPGRKYLTIIRETNRKTRITIFIRFLHEGNNLYVSLESYVLGSTSKLAVIWRILVTILPFLCIMLSIFVNLLAIPNTYDLQYQSYLIGSTIVGSITAVFCCLVPWLFITVPIFWMNVIKSFWLEKDLLLAIRQSYNNFARTNSFNFDDVMLMVKSTLNLVLTSVHDVFYEYDITVKDIDGFISKINNINIQHINGNNNTVSGIGSVAKSVIAAQTGIPLPE